MTWPIILTLLALFVGLFGTLLPVLPGVPVAFLALLGFAYWTHFSFISTQALWIFGILTIFSFLIDFFVPALAAKIQHSSRYGTLGALWGGLAGVIVMGPIGVLVGPFIGAFVGETLAEKPFKQAVRAAAGTLIGILVGSFVKFLIVCAMIVYFIVVLI